MPAAVWALGCRVWRPVDPDSDNLLKGVLDALQLGQLAGSRWLVDDCAVVHSDGGKVYAARGEEPHTEITVEAAGWLPGPWGDHV